MTTRARQNIAFLGAFAAVYVIWGSTFLAIRYAVDTVPPFLMAGIRSLVAGAVLFFWSTRGRFDGLRFIDWRGAAVAGSLLFLGGHGLLAWAEQRVPSGMAALVLTTIPIWMVVLVWIPGGRAPDGKTVCGMGLGVLGVALLAVPWKSSIGLVGEGKAFAALLGSAFLWACGSLYVRRAPRAERPGLSRALQLLSGGALLLLVGAMMGEAGRVDPARISFRSMMSLLYLIIFGSLVAFSAYNWLLRAVEPALVGTYAFVNPVVAVTLGTLVGKERFELASVVAGVAIISGVALVHFSGRRCLRNSSRPFSARPRLDVERGRA